MNSVVSPPQNGRRYRPILELGHGGMAEVHLAVARGPSGFNKLVVLKTMRRNLVPDDELRQMFLGEARLSARLNNANVVQVYEVVDETLPCIVMEYLEGQAMSVVQHAGKERFTTEMQLRVISDVLAGLHYSHELCDYDGTPLNIVHRDVSPHNVFITYEGVVKVVDFGVAKAMNAPGHTRTGIIKGKIAYMPREQMLNEELDRRADIYAVGCMLWHAAAGVKLWSGLTEADIMRALFEGKIPLPSTQRPVDAWLEAIVMKALATDPNERYETALALRKELDLYLLETSPDCTLRDVSSFVSELFSEQRNERAKTIHTSLTRPSSKPPVNDGFGPEPGTGSAASMPRTRTGSHSRPRSDGTEPGPADTPFDVEADLLPEPRPSSKRAFIFVLGGAALLAFAAYFARPLLARDSTRSPTGHAPAPAQRRVELRVSVTPPDASVTVEGNPVPGNPGVLTVPVASAAEPVASSAAPGSTSKPGRTGARFVRPRTPQDPHPAATTGGCDPPFFFEKGIKVYKPGCI